MDLSNLPPLQGQFSTARSSVELSNTGVGFSELLYERDFQEEGQPQRSKFDEHDGEEAVKCLRKCFQVLEPGHHVARRVPEGGSSSFIHCRHSSQLGSRYVSLRQHLQERARVELLRDCLFRLRASMVFVRDLQHLVKEEYKLFYSISHDCVDELPVSKIFCLNALCEDLRTQIGHWHCIKQKLHTNRWLQAIQGSLYFQMDQIHTALKHIRYKAIWWLDKFILIGLQVFSHGNVDLLSQEMIWNVTRGLEDLNKIINSLQHRHHPSTSAAKLGHQLFSEVTLNALNPECTNSLANLGEHVKAIPFTRVLSIIANERSKYAALESHRFFTTNHEFVKLLFSGRLPDYVWTEDSSHTNDKLDRDTSDYHTATGSMTSLSAAVLKVGSLRAPDLSDCDSPLVELGRREHHFAETFLMIVCNSTNLLRKPDTQKSRRVGVKYSQSMMNTSKPPKSETPVMSRSDSLRKSVSWGDSADSSIKSQLTSRYMDLYWNHFGTSLYMMFYEPCWVRQKSLYYSDLGSVVMLNTTVIALVKHMIQHVCLKVCPPLDRDPFIRSDLFPPGSVVPMLNAAKKCMHTAAFGAWDTLMSEAMASHRSDKCYPCPLVNGDYSTRTGMLLRDTYQPMLNLLRENMAETQDPAPGGVSSSLSDVVSVVTRLVATSGVSLQWCRTKIHQYLTNMVVANFLLVSQTDLKILVDEARSSVYQSQMVSKSFTQKAGPEAVVGLNLLSNQLSVQMDSLQSLSGSSMKQFSKNCMNTALEYFKANMPTGKLWKRRPEQDPPKTHNIYIENALETILEPILEGVGKLRQTVQLSVVSLATEALCQAWMTFILQEKIKFSYTGACQLGLDVKYVKTWLQQSIVMETVQQSILDLPVLKTLSGVVLILMKQPSKRSGSKFRVGALENIEDSSVDCIQGERSVYEAEDKIGHVPNPHDWLALRVQGPTRGWRQISSCLNPDA